MKQNKTKRRSINRKINKAINSALDSLLHPIVEIVSPFGPPVKGEPNAAGYDIKADLWDIKTKFLDNAELVTIGQRITEINTHDKTSEEIEELNILLSKNSEGIYAVRLHPSGQFLCPTGIHTSFDIFHSADIQPRSGLSLKKRVTITNSPGLIDCTYKDEWGIILANEGHEDIIIKQGDEIAQVVFRIVTHPKFVQRDCVTDLSGANRGGGFGSTSKHLFKS